MRIQDFASSDPDPTYSRLKNFFTKNLILFSSKSLKSSNLNFLKLKQSLKNFKQKTILPAPILIILFTFDDNFLYRPLVTSGSRRIRIRNTAS